MEQTLSNYLISSACFESFSLDLLNFWKELWGELGGGSHVSLDLHLSLKESNLRIKGSLSQLKAVFLTKSENGIWLDGLKGLTTRCKIHTSPSAMAPFPFLRSMVQTLGLSPFFSKIWNW